MATAAVTTDRDNAFVYEKGQVVESPLATDYIKPQMRKTHDSAVTFEEYHYYAQRTREFELTLEAPKTEWNSLLRRKKETPVTEQRQGSTTNEEAARNMPTEQELANRSSRLEITGAEWSNASRAFRTASRGACK